MKKLIFSMLTLLLMAAPVMAQYYPNGKPIPPRHRASYGNYRYQMNNYGTYYGFRIGLGLSTVNSDSPVLDATDAKTGLNVGFAIGTQLTNMAPLYFESGLYYTEKGGKSVYNNAKFTYGLNYLELPLLIKYRYQVSPDVSIDPFLGGYFACGVGGKIKDYAHREAYSSFGSDYPDAFDRYDAGLKMGCGVSFQMLYLEASYDIGLANVGKDTFDDTRTGCFNLTFGVNF